MADRKRGADRGTPGPTTTARTPRPSTRVALRLAAERDKAIDELSPLADAIDPEALDAIFADRPSEGAFVSFRHEGYAITVTGSGDVLADPIDRE